MRRVYALVLTVMLLTVGASSAFIYPEEERTITIEKTWIKSSATSEGSNQKYLVSDTNNNVYSVEDSITRFQFDASDRFAQLDVGKTYKVTLYGWRIHYLSAYQNIVEIEEVKI